MAKAKVDKEKELKEKLKSESDAQISQLKATAERAVRRKSRKIKRLYIGLIIMAVVIVALAVAGGLSYNKLRNENKKLSNPQESAKIESEKLKSQVAALIDVPNDEEPTIANVSDASKAKEQSPTFFAKAENNDRLLMYPKAKKAILYRPSTNRIIEVSTLNIGNGAAANTGAAAAPATTADPNAVAAPAGTTAP